MSTFLRDRLDDYETVVGDRVATDQGRIGFVNSVKALELLHKHILGLKPIAVHADIDMDGIGSAYIMYKLLLSQGALNRTGFIINKEKEHGISKKHVDYFSKMSIGLLIVLDSSTNEIEYIKSMHCDVLVVDHHDILHKELSGKTAGGEYVIVSNMIDNNKTDEINEWLSRTSGNTAEYVKEYQMDDRMACGLVLYELLKLYEKAYRLDGLLERSMLYQWVGITLFTDAVQLSNSRNQYYIEKTVHSMETEPGLSILMKSLNGFQNQIDKSFINFTLAPAINKAIRASQSTQALDIVLNRPHDIRQLDVYKEAQQAVLEDFMSNVQEFDTYALKDITELGIHSNYCGVLATKICDEKKKNTVVYKVNEKGIAVGSFRGRVNGVDYRKQFESYEDGIYAQGHKPAFGFKVRVEILGNIMSSLTKVEESNNSLTYVSAGESICMHDRGKYHIMNMGDFKRQGNLWKIAMANSKLSSDESINIVASAVDVQFVEQKGKVYWYNVLGMRCMAFEEINSRLVDVYAEYSTEIKIYVKNIRD